MSFPFWREKEKLSVVKKKGERKNRARERQSYSITLGIGAMQLYHLKGMQNVVLACDEGVCVGGWAVLDKATQECIKGGKKSYSRSWKINEKRCIFFFFWCDTLKYLFHRIIEITPSVPSPTLRTQAQEIVKQGPLTHSSIE